MAIKILEISADPFLGGATKHIIILSKFLKKENFGPIIISPNGWLIDEAKRNKIAHFSFQVKSVFDFVAFLKLVQIIKKIRPDLIHFHGTRSGILGIWIKFFFKIPVIYSEHLYTKDYYLRSRVREKLQLIALFLVCFLADKIIAPSVAVRNFLIKNLKINSEKIAVVNNGLESIPIELKQNKELKIGFIGGFNEQKGLKYLIIAMHRLIARFPKLKLEIVGDGSLRKDLESQAQEIKKQIKFLGSQNNIFKYLKNWQLLIIPSVSESFGQVALEAAMASKPVVASSVGGLGEVVVDKETGILVGPRDPNQLVEAISYLLLRPRIVKIMGKKARVRFEQNYSAEIMAEKMSRVYKNVLKNERKN